MKKNILWISILTFCIGITACSDDTLTDLPEDSVALEDFYQDAADFELATVGMYVPLHNIYGNGSADYGAWMMGEMRSDNTCFMYNTANRGFLGLEYVELFTDVSTGGAVATKYENNYIIIQRANQILKYIESAGLDEEDYNNYKGQALFLRAFCYFDLVQYFGEVPIVTTPATTYEDCFTAQSSVEDAYTQIISDAITAAELLPTFSEQSAGFAADGAAYTLLGNVYLVLEEWDNAITALEKVSGYSLMSDYASIFDPSNKNNAELIFSVQYTFDEENTDQASHFAYNFLPRMSDMSGIDGFLSTCQNLYGGWNTPTPDLVAEFDTSDLRFKASIGFYSGSSYGWGGQAYDSIPYIKKYVHGSELNSYADEDFPIYRYAEVLLMLAEAYNEKGVPATALDYLNQVHADARTGLASLSLSTANEIKEAIVKERRIELAFENKRWTDLVRWGTAVEVMSAHGEKIKANPQDYYYPENYEPTSGSYNVEDFRTLFPIPNDEILVNPSLVQNDGY